MVVPLAVEFTLDRADRLIAVGPSWEDVARAHGAPALLASAVCGRPLWDFISDLGFIELYRLLLHQVRLTGPASVRFPFDGGTCCDMWLTLTPLPDGHIDCRTSVAVAHPPEFSRERVTPVTFVVCCGWCGRLRLDDVWWEPHAGLEATSLLMQAEGPLVSHGMCPACERHELDTLGE